MIYFDYYEKTFFALGLQEVQNSYKKDMDLREQINIDITQPFFALSVVLTQQLADFRLFQNNVLSDFGTFQI